MRQVKASDFHHRAPTLVTVLLGSTALLPWAAATATDEEQVQNLQTIVVTAQKRVQTEFDVPASVASIDATGLSNSGLYRLEDFAAQSARAVGDLERRWSESSDDTGHHHRQRSVCADHRDLSGRSADWLGQRVHPRQHAGA